MSAVALVVVMAIGKVIVQYECLSDAVAAVIVNAVVMVERLCCGYDCDCEKGIAIVSLCRAR